jgi:26S proteasome regulatory subunit N9
MGDAIRALADINPDIIGPLTSTIAKNVDEKRWYEAGEGFLALFQLPEIVGQRRTIASNILARFSNSLDPFLYAQLLILAADEFVNADEGIQFLTEFEKTRIFSANEEAKLLLVACVARFQSAKGAFQESHDILNEIESKITAQTKLLLRCALYRSKADFYFKRSDFQNFVTGALLYLSTMHNYTDPTLAYQLCFASLVAKSVCSFTELAEHPLLDALTDTRHEWLRRLIMLLDSGVSDSIDQFQSEFLPILQGEPEFAPHLEVISTKVKLAVFLELIMGRAFDGRVIAFAEIAEACRIARNDVEPLILRAFAGGIIEGHVDQLKGRVTVTWCKPKALGIERLKRLRGQMDWWIDAVGKQQIDLTRRCQAVVGT